MFSTTTNEGIHIKITLKSRLITGSGLFAPSLDKRGKEEFLPPLFIFFAPPYTLLTPLPPAADIAHTLGRSGNISANHTTFYIYEKAATPSGIASCFKRDRFLVATSSLKIEQGRARQPTAPMQRLYFFLFSSPLKPFPSLRLPINQQAS